MTVTANAIVLGICKFINLFLSSLSENTMVLVENDVEMKSADSPPGPEAGDSKRDADLQSLLEIREHARQIEKAISNKESRFILRVLR